jgi:hypothetical protein
MEIIISYIYISEWEIGIAYNILMGNHFEDLKGYRRVFIEIYFKDGRYLELN